AAGTVCKTLIKFPSIVGPNPGQIPAGSRIVNASLGMTIRNKGQMEDAYQITEAWDETSASWNSFAVHGVPGNRGKEFTFTPDHIGRFSVNLTSIAQRWANGEVNDGVLLASTHWDGVDYNSSETVRDRPSLRVQFVPPPSPLVLAYDMETLTPDGRMEDRSGNGNSGTMTGTADVAGKVGRAREFDGRDDRVTAALSSGVPNAWTLALWVKWSDGPNTYEHPIGLGTGHDATFWFRGTTLAFKTSDSSGKTVLDRALSSTATTGTWYHLSATFDGTTVKAYLDGVERFSVAAPATAIRSNSVKVGTSGSEEGNAFGGIIDNVLVYNRALNPSEVSDLIPRLPPSRDPILSYDMQNLTTDGRMQDLS